MKRTLGFFALATAAVSLSLSTASSALGRGDVAPQGTPDKMIAQEVSTVTITSNPANVAVEFSVMPVNAVRVFRNDKAYSWEKDSLVEQDFSNLRDTIALVCTRTVEKTPLALVVGNANISGVRNLSKALASHMRKGRLYPMGVASLGFEKFYSMNSPKDGSPMGYLSVGAGKVVLVWFVPSTAASYDVSELTSSTKEVVRIQLQ
jgi:hypothetical protein